MKARLECGAAAWSMVKASTKPPDMLRRQATGSDSSGAVRLVCPSPANAECAATIATCAISLRSAGGTPRRILRQDDAMRMGENAVSVIARDREQRDAGLLRSLDGERCRRRDGDHDRR